MSGPSTVLPQATTVTQGGTTAPVSTTAPTGTEAGLYVRIVSQPGGAGSAVTVADGADVTQGATTDAAWVSGNGSVVSLLKKIASGAASDVTDRAGRLLGITTVANLDVALSTRTKPSDQQHAIVDSSALPAGASTETTLAALNTKVPAQGQALAAASLPVVLTAVQQTALTPPAAIAGFALESGHLATIDTSTARIPAQGQALAAASMPVVLTAAQVTTLTPLASVGVNNFPATQAVSLATNTPDVTDRAGRLLGHVTVDNASLAVTLATAPSTPVTNAGTFAVQAAATLAAETTKVIGTVNVAAGQSITANAGTNLNTSALALDATLTGGTQKAISRGGAKGTTTAADVTSAAVDANTQALHTANTFTANATASGTISAIDIVVGTSNGTGLAVTGTPTANSTVVLPLLGGEGTVAVTIGVGSSSTNYWFEASSDSTNGVNGMWYVIPLRQENVTVGSTVTSSNNTSSAFRGACGAAKYVRVRAVGNTITTPPTVTITASSATGSVNVAGGIGPGVASIGTVATTLTASGQALPGISHAVATYTFDIVVGSGKGIRVWQDLTVLGASSVVTFKIQEKDPQSLKFFDLLASAATGAGINAVGTAKLTIYPGLTAVANSVASDVVPVNVRISATVATAASTFGLGYAVIP